MTPSGILLAVCMAASWAASAPRRGVLEGFYGRPWSWEQRGRMADWAAGAGFDLLVIAPQDEPLQRSAWREPLTRAYLEGLSRLQRRAAARGVALAWALRPLGADFSDPEEARAAARKFESVLRLGVRMLVLGVDDLEPELDQVLFADRVLAALERDWPEAEWTFIPAEYWGAAAPSPYLDLVARRLDPRYRVAWTGKQIISRRIRSADAAGFHEVLRHPLVLGDNYPVQDRLLDSGPLYLGPLLGREPGLALLHEAIVFNASPLPEASKVALGTAAQWLRDPEGYDPEAAWERAIAEQGGREPRWLRRLARESSGSWLAVPRPDFLRRDTFEEAAAEYWAGRLLRAHGGGIPSPHGSLSRGAGRLRALIEECAALPAGLAAGVRPELAAELRPWAEKLALEARAARQALDLLETPPGRRRFEDRRELDALAERAASEPALVGGGALGRFAALAAAVLDGYAPPAPASLEERLLAFVRRGTGRSELEAALRGLEGLSFALRAAGVEETSLPEACPWLEALAESARGVRLALGGSRSPPPAPPAAWTRRWRGRLRFVPLLASRRLIEGLLAQTDAALGLGPPARPLPLLLRLWLAWNSWRRPDSLPARLAAGLARDPSQTDHLRLEEALARLARAPSAARKLMGSGLPWECLPWLEKAAAHGRLGLKALALRESGRPAGPEERAAWELERYRLRSANGLELAAETKLLLDRTAAWLVRPRERRPPEPDLALPANPAEAL